MRLGQPPEIPGRGRVPAGVEGHLGLAVVTDLERQLGRRGRAAELQLARARAGEVVELHSLHLRHPPGGRER